MGYQPNKLFYGLAVMVLSCAALHAGDGDAPEAQQLIQAANEVTDLSKLEPYEFTADVVVAPGSQSEKSGRVSIHRGQGRSRWELEMQGYREIRVLLDNKLYVWRSSADVADVDGLYDLDRKPRLRFPADTRFSHVSLKKIEDSDAYCFNFYGERGQRTEKTQCMDATRKTPLGNASKTSRFLDYAMVSGQWFPGRILLPRSPSRAPIEVRNIKIKPMETNAESFAVPGEALVFDTCDLPEEGRLLHRVEPSYPLQAKKYHIIGDVILYVVVGTDGYIYGIRALSGPQILAQEAIRVVQQWRYTPTMCGANPIAIETQITVRFHMN